MRQRDIWTYWDNAGDAGLQPVARYYDKASRLTSIANDVSTITYTYDAAGQVLTENSNIAGGPSGGRTQTYHRYGNGAVSRLGYPGGSWFQRNYNARGELIVPAKGQTFYGGAAHGARFAGGGRLGVNITA